MNPRLTALLAILSALAISSTAWAGRAVSSGTYGYESISAGVFEIGLDNIMLIRYYKQSDPDKPDEDYSSTQRILYTGGLTPRLVIAKNLSVSLNINLFIQKTKEEVKAGSGDAQETTVEDLGFLGVAMVNYYMRLGGSLFFKPGVGAGFFTGTRETPVPGKPEQKLEKKITAGVGRVDLGFAYYASKHFNLKAGPDFLMRFGKEKDDDDEHNFMAIDAGFNIGLAYSF